MQFPFKNKKVVTNTSKDHVLEDYSHVTELPVLPHPGAFSCPRKNHIHEGIDLYCMENEGVFAMEPGVVVNIGIFTGEEIGMPWWRTTWAVLVEGPSGVINYAELVPNSDLQVGIHIEEGSLIGHVTPVLKKNKGRPMNMLHLELYSSGTIEPIQSWALDTPKPEQLQNPMILLEPFLNKKPKIKL